MAEEQVAEAPEGAQDAPESTPEEPTPVREGMPTSEREAEEQGWEEAQHALAEKYSEGEGEDQETEEAPEQAPEEAEAPETTAEDAVSMDEGPEASQLPEDYFYDSQGRLKDGEGRYVSPDALTTDEEPAEASGEEVSSPSEDPDAEADSSEVPEGFERVELPEAHPLRERGETHLAIPSAEQVGEQTHQYYRHLINAGARERQARSQMGQLQQRLARLEAERQVRTGEDAQDLDPDLNPELRAQIEDIRQAYGDEAADRHEQALRAALEQRVDQRAEQQLSQQQHKQQATQFAAQVANRANQKYELWPGQVTLQPVQTQNGATEYRLAGHGERYQRIAQAMHNYGKLVETHGTQPSVQEFEQFLDHRYVQDPRVRQKVKEYREKNQEKQREQVAEEVKSEAEEAERERLKEAAEKRENNPMGQVGGSDTDRTTPRPETEGLDFDATGMSEGEIDRKVREALFNSG